MQKANQRLIWGLITSFDYIFDSIFDTNLSEKRGTGGPNFAKIQKGLDILFPLFIP